MENYRIIRAKSRRTIRSSRRQSWQTFVSKINSRTSLKKVWNLVSKISGKKSPTAIHHLNVNNNEITSETDIVNSFGHTFSSNSSSEHYTHAFNAHRQKVQKRPLKFKSNNNETYNCLFSLQELTAAIEETSTRRTAYRESSCQAARQRRSGPWRVVQQVCRWIMLTV